jgi:hypothetical protein
MPPAGGACIPGFYGFLPFYRPKISYICNMACLAEATRQILPTDKMHFLGIWRV